MTKKRKLLASKISPSSIIGDHVKIVSRHIVMPFQKIKYTNKEKDCEHVKFFFTGKIIDNSVATISKITERTCFKNKYTISKLDDNIRGLEITIKTEEKVREHKISKVKESGRHNAQYLNLSKFTFAELIKEDRDIICSNDYHKLKELKLILEKDKYIVY